jgi:hypothetical protein
MLSLLAYMMIATAPAPEPPEVKYRVGGREFVGVTTPSCVIRGEWRDGEPFWYRAWDACENISVSWVPAPAHDQVVEQRHGVDRTFVIPAGTESLTVGNHESVVQLFKDRDGSLQNILIAD